MVVRETDTNGRVRTMYRNFIIHDRQSIQGRWEYQLRDGLLTGNVYEGGKWFSETALGN